MPTTYAIPNGRTAMDATIYTANGGVQTVSNADNGTTGFLPDLIWTKTRSAIGNNVLINTPSGVANYLHSNDTDAQATDANYVTGVGATGFSLGSGNYTNGTTMVAWQWKAASNTTVSNTSGSITSTVSANATAGFSIVNFTSTSTTGSATIGHGLGAVPGMIIMKDKSFTYNWDFWSSGLGSIGNTLILNLTDPVFTTRQPFTTTAPTSSVFSFNQGFYARSGDNIVAYCWTPIAGFSQFGSYTGNNSDDGPFVYCGFRPKWVMLKNATGTARGWYIFDSTRDPYNAAYHELLANVTDAEYTGDTTPIDFVSNGFKIRKNYIFDNESGKTIIYAAFAENPFKYANAR